METFGAPEGRWLLLRGKRGALGGPSRGGTWSDTVLTGGCVGTRLQRQPLQVEAERTVSGDCSNPGMR